MLQQCIEDVEGWEDGEKEINHGDGHMVEEEFARMEIKQLDAPSDVN